MQERNVQVEQLVDSYQRALAKGNTSAMELIRQAIELDAKSAGLAVESERLARIADPM